MGSNRAQRRKRQKAMRPSPSQLASWAEKTDAEMMSEASFLARKAERSWFVLGVMGFAGSWKRSGYRGEGLVAYQTAMKAAITKELQAAQERHGEQLVVSSGATDLGVLQLTYQVCTELGILALGVTPQQTLRYQVARLDLLILHGHRYGDESQVFLKTADALLLVGGGLQSKRETEQGARMGMPITVVQGFGGVADDFGPETLPSAVFVQVAREEFAFVEGD